MSEGGDSDDEGEERKLIGDDDGESLANSTVGKHVRNTPNQSFVTFNFRNLMLKMKR